MEKIKVSIGNKEFKVSLAKTEEEHQKGLQGVKDLLNNEGMLFSFDSPQESSFWMKDTEIPLDIIFINDELSVISIHEGIPLSEDFMTEDNVSYVLEVNKDSGIKQNDELEFISNNDLNSKMYVLDPDGNPQMTLDGEERIFSRPNTKTLIKFAKKAQLLNRDIDYKALGTRLFKFLKIQDENGPEYVELKDKKE